MKKPNTLALVALATGGMLFASSTAYATDKAAEKTQKEKSACSGPNGCDGKDHKCVGGNSCKGSSSCHTEKSKCKGSNSCKGKGWVNTKTDEECKEAQKANAAPAASAEKKG